MARALRGALLVAGILGLTAGSAHAQASGSIFGKVTDASGGVLPGVTVTVTGPTLQQPISVVTAETGAYQIPNVPIGTYGVSFELASFKKATRQNVVITDGFNAQIDMKLEIGAVTEEMTVTAASPVVDTKKTSTSAVFTKEIFENIPTARDPWQIINMTPGVQAGLNVGGSSSGQQVGLNSRGTGANVQWNLEGGSITDLSSNSSPAYFNFDSFEQISVTNGGGDVSVQSSGLSINLVTKSGSNLFKGSVLGTFQNDKMQGNNVSQSQFDRGTSGFLSGAPIFKIYNASIEYGGPILRNRLWWWAAADRQEINAGVVNFFDRSKGETCASYAEAQRTGNLLGSITYGELDAVQNCLSNDQTVIRNLNWKFNYQASASHKFMYQFHSDNKVRNAPGASADTEKEATTQQTSDKPWGFPLPSHQISHTWLATDKLVFNTMFTKVFGGFFLDYQDYNGCGGSTRYLGADNMAAYQAVSGRRPDCMFNIQPQTIQTTSNQSRSLGNSYQTVRPSLDVKTDATYFLTNFFGGDHSLKFGVGYRQNPILSYNHISGGGRATVQCVGNALANCGDGRTYVAPGAAAGLVARQASLTRDTLTNNDWWSYNGYIQDSYSRGRIRINAGLRYDWQQSKWLGGCVPENPIVPHLLPGYCEPAATGGINAVTGEFEELQPFSNFSPRISATYDLFGNGKTALKGSASYYYQTKITLANSLSGLGTATLTWGANATSGACTGSSCWTDLNLDGFIQLNELSGTPSTNTTRFNVDTGVLTPTGNSVDKSAKLGRTREGTVGVSHELFANFAVGAEFIYRRYDNGTAAYTIGFQPGEEGFPLSQIYTGPLTHTDPQTGLSANYYQVLNTGPCPVPSLQAMTATGELGGCRRPSGVGTITITNLEYQTYKGVDLTVTKRYSDRWQMNMALTIQNRLDFSPVGSFTDPTGVEYDHGFSSLARYIFKLSGSYNLPFGITAATNLNINDGANRNLTIAGPGAIPNGRSATGTQQTINRNTLNFEPSGSTRFERQTLLDAGIHKTFSFNGGRQRVKFMLDGFNIMNASPVLSFSSSNISSQGTATNPTKPSERISSVLPPRVFRVGTTVWF